VYFVVSSHTKRFRSVYGKVFLVDVYWDVLLCHTTSVRDFIGTQIEENSWCVDKLKH
jgi:hypothetical protein